MPTPRVLSLFDERTATATHVVSCPRTGAAAVIDSVLDFDPRSGRIWTDSARQVVRHVREHGLQVHWHLETHAHADHLSAAPWLKRELGGRIGIGSGIRGVQQEFKRRFHAGYMHTDGRPFDRLFDDGEHLALGELDVRVMATPGHTPACVSYVVQGQDVFVGDTLFGPDYGTARCDFPGGDATSLYRSIRKLLALADQTRLHLCHDYRTGGRAVCTVSTVQAQRAGNVHVHDGVDEAAFVAMRTARDRTLAAPELMLPAVQVNVQAGELPPPEANGVRYLKIPLHEG
jgi:glyoxylase-like metal-dependent hydrolase (beta-lactamase superfamily II)